MEVLRLHGCGSCCVLLCGAMGRKKPIRDKATPADYEATRLTVERHRKIHAGKKPPWSTRKLEPTPSQHAGKIQSQSAPCNKPSDERTVSPPAKRLESRRSLNEMAKRGKGSGSGGGKVKSAGSTDVDVPSDGEGSKSKIRGRGGAPEVQHEPAVGSTPRVLTRNPRP